MSRRADFALLMLFGIVLMATIDLGPGVLVGVLLGLLIALVFFLELELRADSGPSR